MKKILYSLIDPYTLQLQEDAQKGDQLDLRHLNDQQLDSSAIDAIVAAVKEKTFAAELEKEKAAFIREQQLQAELAAQQQANEQKMLLAEKEQLIAELKKEAERTAAAISQEKNFAISAAKAEKEKEIITMKAQLSTLQAQLDAEKANLENDYQKQLRDKEAALQVKDAEIALHKDFKSRLSTKMVGESLEQHCEIQFNSLRAAAFPNAYFEKDSAISESGSKGDYIFRETDPNDPHATEIISIMFEMKNENQTTATKKKNEDFLKELDKDRREKGCEYAVLVSLLEADNELYNAGIVDMSHRYPKMYIIRPQFFIPIISLLRNAAMASLQYKQELQQARMQSIDITRFEENITKFKDEFSRNYSLASSKFNDAIAGIDKTIKELEKTKAALLSSENNLRLASEKAHKQLTIKRLTKDSPKVKALFEEINMSQ